VSALFVTATGTDVGKTYVAVELITALRAARRVVRALKPIASGFDPAAPESSDSGKLLSALGLPVSPAALDEVTPWRFAAPLSPDMAAAREGRVIDWSSLVSFCRRAIDEAGSDGVTFIEGVGGLMVPIDDRHTVLDLIAALGIPSLLVAGSYLGTLSHTLTAAGMLANRGCQIAAIVIDESASQPVEPHETAAALARFVGAVPIFVLRRAPRERAPGERGGETVAAIRGLIERLAL
jgi:dethiobiotin synthetase